MEYLNLYANIGGNVAEIEEIEPNVKVTAVEIDPKIAEIYQHFFPKHKVVIGDAHEFLLQNYRNYDFIWVSRPCQSHSSMRKNLAVRFRGTSPVFPDFGLYEEIIFLQHHADNKTQRWVCENVNPYYEPLIKPNGRIGRHLFWSNFQIPQISVPKDKLRSAQIPDLQIHTGFDLSKFQVPNKRQVLRNCVNKTIGKVIFKAGIDSLAVATAKV